ncbi:Anthranilate synthase component 2 (plasmid) [Buchnera aphidicola (Anoecia corni)]|uniref:anthranilate synthase n=1 Tax=Buchnera aphidicola (Anoecia corni) TaxID=2994477 RepID=A0AAT9J3M1_9GAMM
MANILLLDNIDSFTYNLVDQLRVYKHNVLIIRNNINLNIIINILNTMKDPIIFLSPGPGSPEKAGCMLALIEYSIGKFPIVGICLGHQAIVKVYGGKINYLGKVVHGKKSFIKHDNFAMFYNLPNPLSIARYHSLFCEKVSSNFTINAFYKNLIMGIRDDKLQIYGFQFHPESILTLFGDKLLNNTLKWIIKNNCKK